MNIPPLAYKAVERLSVTLSTAATIAATFVALEEKVGKLGAFNVQAKLENRFLGNFLKRLNEPSWEA